MYTYDQSEDSQKTEGATDPLDVIDLCLTRTGPSGLGTPVSFVYTYDWSVDSQKTEGATDTVDVTDLCLTTKGSVRFRNTCVIYAILDMVRGLLGD